MNAARRTARLVGVGGLLAAAGLVVGPALGSAAQAAPGTATSAQPVAVPVHSDPRLILHPANRGGFDSARSGLDYSATPGGRIRDYVAVRNPSAAAMRVTLRAGDLSNGPGGRLIVAAQGSHDLGAWVRLDQTVVQVPAHSDVVVPFTVRLPAATFAGDHNAAILATSPSAGAPAVQATLTMHLAVAGAASAGLAVRDVRVSYVQSANPFGAGTARVSYEVLNAGHLTVAASALVELQPVLVGARHTVRVPTGVRLLPGSAVRQSVVFTDVAPGVQVRTSVLATIVGGTAAQSQSGAGVGSASTWSLPWALLLLVLLLGLGARLCAYVIKRRPAGAPPVHEVRPDAGAARRLVGAAPSLPSSTPTRK